MVTEDHLSESIVDRPGSARTRTSRLKLLHLLCTRIRGHAGAGDTFLSQILTEPLSTLSSAEPLSTLGGAEPLSMLGVEPLSVLSAEPAPPREPDKTVTTSCVLHIK